MLKNSRDINVHEVSTTAVVTIWLWAKPGWMLGEGTEAEPEKVEKAAHKFMDHLTDVSEVLRKLRSNGWESTFALFDIYCEKDIDKDEAAEELKDLGIELGEGIDLNSSDVEEVPEEYQSERYEEEGEDDEDYEILDVDIIDPWDHDDLGVGR